MYFRAVFLLLLEFKIVLFLKGKYIPQIAHLPLRSEMRPPPHTPWLLFSWCLEATAMPLSLEMGTLAGIPVALCQQESPTMVPGGRAEGPLSLGGCRV